MYDPDNGLVSLDGTMVITAEVVVRNESMSRLCAKAAAEGNLELLKWLRVNSAAWDKTTCSAAAAGGHLEILKYARLHRCPRDESTCKSAADGGHLEALKWARDKGCRWDSWACPLRAGPEHREVMRYFMEQQQRASEAIPGIPLEVVIKHVLGSENMTPRDLAQLRLVSPAMRDAVAATGRKVEKPKQRVGPDFTFRQ